MNRAKHIYSGDFHRDSVRKVSYRFYDIPAGEVVVASTGEGLCALEFVRAGRESAKALLRARFPKAELEEREEEVHARTYGYISGKSTQRPPLHLCGTEFQRRVWECLCKIPVAKTVTYKDIAQTLGCPSAVRAVANAVAANPVAIVVPCHRVVRSDGSPGGYRWGRERKMALLERETGEVMTCRENVGEKAGET